jgi:APA family basic amino acid/polyamine antiporter
MIVAGLLVGIIPFNLIDINGSLSGALHYNDHNILAIVISIGVVIGMVSVILVQIFALSRIILVTARDGLLPNYLAKIHPKYNTPYVSTILLGSLVALIAGFMPLTVIGTLSSVGALSSFMVVCIAMLTLRHKYPNVKRPFKCPLALLVSGVGILLCSTLLFSAMQQIGIYIAAWLFIGLAVYFAYARFRTKV